MSTLRINNIEAQSIPASPTLDEKVKITNSSGDILVNIDGKTSGITTIGINTTDGNIKFDQNSNVVVTGIITATKFSGDFDPNNVNASGIVTATNFVGNGANLTGIITAGNLPAIYSVTPTTYTGTAGTTFTLHGDRFKNNTTVFFRQSTGSKHAAATVSFVGVTTLTATTPANFYGGGPLDVIVTSNEGLSAEIHNAITVDAIPGWNTAAGTIATITDRYGSYTGIATLSASDIGGDTITYSIVSGSLPAGCSLNSSTGVISGDPTDIGSATVTSNFTARASDGTNNVDRAFSIRVDAAKDGTASYRAGISALALKAVNPSITSGNYYIDPYTAVPANSNPVQYACAFSNTAADDGWMTVDLSDVATTSRWAFRSGTSNVQRNWNGSRLLMNSQNSGNHSHDWKAMIMDRKLLGRIDDVTTGCRDWDMSGYLSQQWGWAQFRFVTKEWFNSGIGMPEGFSGSGGGTIDAQQTGAASVGIQNNSSNNFFGYFGNWYNGTNYSGVEVQQGSGTGSLVRALLVQGVLKVYKAGSLVQTLDMTSQTASPVTANTKWYWFNYHQSVSSVQVTSLRVRNPAT